MRIVFFCHSLISDWNHGNAHFLRGIVRELLARGHQVVVYEPANGWSLTNLLAEAGPEAIARFHRAFPGLRSRRVNLDRLPLDEALDGADLVIVHEWNPHDLVARIGAHRALRGRYVLLFHDTHHRSMTDVGAMEQYALESYDGVLAFGEVIRRGYESRGWARRAWTWHEAADTRVFRPMARDRWDGDLVWIGNWGDEERSAEIRHYLIEPARHLHLATTIYGVRYPESVQDELAAADIAYRGWLANYDAPMAYARHRMTVHIPRRPYVEALPGIPTIRVFEALAAGVPLVSAPWVDVEALFTPGEDFLIARSPAEMRRHLAALAADRSLREELVGHGLNTIRTRHTCAHRVDELLDIVRQIRGIGVPQVLTA
jgi:spore maturation protein CgeB